MIRYEIRVHRHYTDGCRTEYNEHTATLAEAREIAREVVKYDPRAISESHDFSRATIVRTWDGADIETYERIDNRRRYTIRRGPQVWYI